MLKTQQEVRNSFWELMKECDEFYTTEYLKEYKRNKRQNDYSTDIRCKFVGYVDNLQLDGVISEKLAFKVTL